MKDENVELLKRVKSLQQEKVQLTRLYKKQMAEFMEARKKLSEDTKR